MGIDVKEFERLRQRVKRLRSDVDKAEGALQQTMERIENEFKCSSIDEAKQLEQKKRKQADKAQTDYEKALESFRNEWEDRLDSG